MGSLGGSWAPWGGGGGEVGTLDLRGGGENGALGGGSWDT